MMELDVPGKRQRERKARQERKRETKGDKRRRYQDSHKGRQGETSLQIIMEPDSCTRKVEGRQERQREAKGNKPLNHHGAHVEEKPKSNEASLCKRLPCFAFRHSSHHENSIKYQTLHVRLPVCHFVFSRVGVQISCLSTAFQRVFLWPRFRLARVLNQLRC